MFILWISYILFMRKVKVNYKYVFFIVILILIIMSFLIPILIEALNYYRQAFFIENGGLARNYINMTGIRDFFLLISTSGFYFLLKPLPFEAHNSFQLIQSIINIVVVGFLLKFTIVNYKIDRKITLFWL